MNEQAESSGNKTGKGRRYLRVWLILAGAVFLILLIGTQLLPGGRRSFSDWMPSVLFLFGVSVAAATALIAVWVVGRWVCQWRVLRRVLIVGAGLAGLIALFYAEEDWRGWHAWNQFKQQWEAKGELFNLASVVPAPVAEDENFALTPIVFTSYGQILTREGKLIPAEKRDEHFVERMRMPLTLDYASPTNCAGDRVKETFTRLFGINVVMWDGLLDTSETVSALRELDVQALRWPGGSPADDYHWALNRNGVNLWTWATPFSSFIHVALQRHALPDVLHLQAAEVFCARWGPDCARDQR